MDICCRWEKFKFFERVNLLEVSTIAPTLFEKTLINLSTKKSKYLIYQLGYRQRQNFFLNKKSFLTVYYRRIILFPKYFTSYYM